MSTTRDPNADIMSADGKRAWVYSEAVKRHFFDPQNFLSGELEPGECNGMGRVGSPACGDELRVWLQVDPASERIKKFWWKTFGCASAIASASVTSVMVLEGEGMTLAQARAINPRDIMERLGGLPPRKFHCSVLSDKALRDAVNDYYRRARQFDKIEPEATRVIDPVARVTDKDIEEAVLAGHKTLESVAEHTGLHVDDPSRKEEAEQLIRFYIEKYS